MSEGIFDNRFVPSTKEQLEVLIGTIAQEIDGHPDYVLSREDMELIQSSLVDFVFASITKYIAGQRKHGGSILDRDLNHELYMEHIDEFWYMWAKAKQDADKGSGNPL